MLNSLTVLAPAAHAPAGAAASGAATGAAHCAGNAANSDGHSQAFARLLQRATAPTQQPVIKQPVAAHAAAPPARPASPHNSAAANHTADTDAADAADALIDPRKATQRAADGPTATDLFNPQWAPHAALLPALQSPQLADSAVDMLAAQGLESPAAVTLGASGPAARALPMIGLLPALGPHAASPGTLTATAAAAGVDDAAVAASQAAAGGPGAAAPDSFANAATPLASANPPVTAAAPDAPAPPDVFAPPAAPGPPQPAVNAMQPVAAPNLATHAASYAAPSATTIASELSVGITASRSQPATPLASVNPPVTAAAPDAPAPPDVFAQPVAAPNLATHAATHAAPSATTIASELSVGITASRSQPATPAPRPGALFASRRGDAAGALTEAGYGVQAPSRPAPGPGHARSPLADIAPPWVIDVSARASLSRAPNAGIDAGAGAGAAGIVAVADASATPMPLLSGLAGSPATSGASGLASTPATDGGQPLHREAHIGAAVTSPEFAPALGLSISTLARDGTQQARLHLNPAELGPITVTIALDGVGARVDFQADASTTRQAIEASLPALAGALREAGLTLTGGGVFQQPQGRPSGQDAAPGRQARGAQAGLDIGDIGGAAGGTLPALHARRGLVDLVA